MKCPNCKQELMNVNGRYICVDCGTEVPENEIPVAQSEFDASEAKVQGNEYLYDDVSEKPATTEPEMPVAAPEVTVPVETAAVEATPAVVTPTPPVEETVAPVAAPEETFQPVAETPIAETPVMPGTPVVSPEPLASDTPVSEEPAATANLGEEYQSEQLPSAEETAVMPEETPIQAPEAAEGTFQPEENSFPQAAVEQAPVEDIQSAPTLPDYNFSAAAAEEAPADPNVYQAPSFQNNEEQDDPKALTSSSPASSRKLLLILIGGGLGALILLVSGIILYRVLTTPVVVENPISDNVVIDCGLGSTDSAAGKCFAQSFKECKLATYETTITEGQNVGTYAYSVVSSAEDGCNVESHYNESANAELLNKSMTCRLDNQKTFVEAVKESSSKVCTGDLVDVLFPSSTE